MRVTVGSASYQSISSIQSAASQLAALQQQLSSGNKISTPSDDPTGTVQALQLRGALARNTQYSAGADDAIAWLSTADNAYSQIVTTTQQARTLVVQALNSGANDSTTTDSIASQLDSIRTALIGLANTSYNGRPVFGGTTAGGTAYAADGTYTGDSGAVTRAVGPQDTVTVSATGPDVFGSDGSDLFSTLSSIASTLRSDPTSSTLSDSLSALDSAISRVSTAQATEGATYQQVQRSQTSGTSAATSMKTRLSGIEDIDFAETTVKVATANTTYNAALQTTASIGQLSLLDFLR